MASIGVMVVMTGLMSQRLGTAPVSVDAILPTNVWTLGSVRISSDRVWFAAAILGIAIAIAVAFRFTRFGLHTRAAAETEKGALVSGIAPDRIAALNWMISAAVAAIAGILIAPIVPLVPISYTLFIVPALAAAVLGRFQYVHPGGARWARHRHAAVGGDVLPEPAHLAAELRPARARSARS